MYPRTIARLLLAVSLFLSFPLAALRAADGPVKSLPAHLAESGIPSEGEIALVDGWLKGMAAGQQGGPAAQAWFDNWIGAGLPFTFRYDGKDFAGTSDAWQFHGSDVRRQANVETQEWTWLHAKTGLKATWHIKRFLDYPAVDTLLTFENTGSTDTAAVEGVQNLDVKMNQSQPGKTYTIHGAHGGRCGVDDLMPFTRMVAVARGPSLSLLRQDFEKLEINRSVIKTPLRIGQRKFAHGLGTHSISRLCIRSPKPIEHFSAWVGVDCNEQTRGGAGSVVFSVSSKQGQLFKSGVLRGGQAPVKIDLAVPSADTLYLEVGDAGDGPSCDHADWADGVVTFQGGQTARLDELASATCDVVQFGSAGSSSNQELPFFNIETPENRGVLVGFGWTGNWQAEFTASGTQLESKAGMPTTNFRLHPGEQVRGPRVLLVFWKGQCLHGHNMLRRVIYEHYLPRMPDGKPHQPLVSVNTCFTYHGGGGYLEKVTEQTLSALVRPFIELGAEAYVIDAGYYNCKGWPDLAIAHNGIHDCSPNKERFPHGFDPIRKPLAAAGIYFGLWFPPEFWGSMADPKVRETFLKVVDDYADNQGITFYRQDQGSTPGGEGPDRWGIPEMKYIAGLYEMQDQILKRHPHMLMEGCCGGGRRIDLESLSRFHWHQKSDSWFNTITDQCGMYGGNLYMPGGVLNLPTQATDNFGIWSSFGGQLCLAWHPLDKDFPMELAKRQVKLYKQVRQYLSGDFYPLTDCTLERPWLAYQFHRNDLDGGFALIFKRRVVGQPGAPAPEEAGRTFTFAPHGLDPQARYAISCQASGEKAVYTGAELANGVKLTLKETPAAELVIYQKQP